MFYTGLNRNTNYNTQEKIAEGAEGEIHTITGNVEIVAKIYTDNKIMDLREQKLKAMLKINPEEHVTKYCSWPLDMLYGNGDFVGYVMRSFRGLSNLIEVYNHDNRKDIPWKFFVHLALNLSIAVDSIHGLGQVIGDLNPKNIMVDMKNGYTILVDTDSFHIKDDNNKRHRCIVGYPECVAPYAYT